jgi:hypothetical protein
MTQGAPPAGKTLLVTRHTFLVPNPKAVHVGVHHRVAERPCLSSHVYRQQFRNLITLGLPCAGYHIAGLAAGNDDAGRTVMRSPASPGERDGERMTGQRKQSRSERNGGNAAPRAAEGEGRLWGSGHHASCCWRLHRRTASHSRRQHSRSRSIVSLRTWTVSESSAHSNCCWQDERCSMTSLSHRRLDSRWLMQGPPFQTVALERCQPSKQPPCREHGTDAEPSAK